MTYFWVMLFGVIVGFGLGVFIDIVQKVLCWVICMSLDHLSPVFRDSGVYCTFCETWEIRYDEKE